jgi:hypothetical protein
MQNNDNNDSITVDENENKNKDKVQTDDDVNVLSGDNKVDVEIEPDVKGNKTNMYFQICSCSLIFHCFSNNKKKIETH